MSEATGYPAGRALLDPLKATRAELEMELQWLRDNDHLGLPYTTELFREQQKRRRVDGAVDNLVDHGAPPSAIAAFEVAVRQAVEEIGGPLCQANVQAMIRVVCDETAEMLLEKNRSYGNSVIEPIRIFAKDLTPLQQVNVRIDDKLSRLARGTDEMNEDTEFDLLGYLLLKRVLKRLLGSS